jgi:predicted ATPase
VFANGFTLAAAKAVTGHLDAVQGSIASGIANLVGKSLAVFDGSATPARWKLLETVRLYALEQLAAHDEIEDASQLRAVYFRDLLVAGSVSGWRYPTDELTRLIHEVENVRATLDWCFSVAGDTEIGIDLTATYGPVWLHLSLVSECRDRCEQALRAMQPDGAAHAARELKLRAALGSALLATMGPAEQTKAALVKAVELAGLVGNLDLQARALLSLSGVLVFRGEYGEASTVVERLRRVAHRIGDPSIAAVADRRMGQTLLTIGRLGEAQECFESVLRVSVPLADQSSTVLYRFDDRATARAMLARVLCLRGFTDQADNEARASLDGLHDTKQQLSLCRALYFGLCRTALLTGQLGAAEHSIARLSDAATSSGAPFWQVVGRLLEGKLMVARGEFARGVATLRDAFDVCRRTGWRASYPEFMGALAEGLGGLGQFDEALEAVNAAIAAAGEGADGQVWYVPELLRVKGELLGRQPADPTVAAAEHCFAQGNAMARAQGALFWELKIAISFARFMVSQGRLTEARSILLPVHDRFTEGFEMVDLRIARALLDGLPA